MNTHMNICMFMNMNMKYEYKHDHEYDYAYTYENCSIECQCDLVNIILDSGKYKYVSDTKFIKIDFNCKFY